MESVTDFAREVSKHKTEGKSLLFHMNETYIAYKKS